MVESKKSKYPYGLDDKDLKKELKKYMDEFVAPGEMNQRIISKHPSLILLGHNELQSRQTKKVTLFSFLVSIVSLIVALSALVVSCNSSK